MIYYIYMKQFFIILFLIGLGFFGYLGYQRYDSARDTIRNLNATLQQKTTTINNQSSLESQIKTLESEIDQQKIYTILAGGDIMLDRGVEGKIKKLDKNYDFAFDLIRNDFNAADFVFANLEGPISDLGADTGKKYSFRFEPAVAQALKNAGIDIVSLANNHMFDWGRNALCQTTQLLDKQFLFYVGAGCNSQQAEKAYTFTLGNTTVAILAYTEFYKGAHARENSPGISEYDIKKIQQRIDELRLKQSVDIVMVSMHWGEEYKDRATDHQVTMAHELINTGANVIIGHHPHVDQEIERYKDGWIIYSLGNLVFDQSWSENTMEGLLAEIQIQNKRVYDTVPKKIQLNENFQPAIVK